MQKPIKSFVLRAGRVSPRQQQGLDLWLPDYLLSLSETPWDLTAAFGRVADTVVEIGFGMGASLVTMAMAEPETNFVGIEVHRAGIGSLVADLHDKAITNVRVATVDAVDVFKTCLAPQSLKGVQLFFPDPWPKKRHHKRRLIQDSFIHLLVSKIKKGGFLHCATDWEDYAMHIQAVLNREPALKNSQTEGDFSERPDTRPLTKFEQRGTRLGHGVWDLIYILR